MYVEQRDIGTLQYLDVLNIVTSLKRLYCSQLNGVLLYLLNFPGVAYNSLQFIFEIHKCLEFSLFPFKIPLCWM